MKHARKIAAFAAAEELPFHGKAVLKRYEDMKSRSR
jgi:hypothetical protein